MDFADLITIDFETKPIAQRPAYPPEAVGVSVKVGRAPSRYYAFGHPSGNGAQSREWVTGLLGSLLDSPRPLLFHNAKFDLAVMCEGLGLPEPDWRRIHDTTFLVFLADPHSRSVGLKEIAAEWLDWPAEERDAIGEWVWEHRQRLFETTGRRPTRNDGKVSRIGEWIAYCPGDVVAPYATGDTDRTYALFEHLYPLVVEHGMRAAYNRERRLLPILMENERRGMRVDVGALERDVARYTKHREVADEWLRSRLGNPYLNIDSDADFAEALAHAGVVDADQWSFTKTGKRSVSKKALKPSMYNDPEVAAAFGYRNRLGTALKMFMEPWAAQGAARGGYISTNWNQIRGGDAGGTRTGRPSTTDPNLLNISKDFESKKDGYEHPSHLAVDPLPLVRSYVLSDPGGLFIHRDFDGQELRIFGNYECGELYRAYKANPRLDVHALVGEKMAALKGLEFDRTSVKIINFQSIYGGGLPALMASLDISEPEAREFKAFHDAALPGRKVLDEEIRRVVGNDEPIRTWGGRVYFPEPPRHVDGRLRRFEYKLLNYLVQGSAADCTKEALIRWHDHPDRAPEDRFLVTVYDEINISAPRERAVEAMRVLKESMEGLELDVPMLSSPKAGASWGSCQKPKDGENEDDFVRRIAEDRQ